MISGRERMVLIGAVAAAAVIGLIVERSLVSERQRIARVVRDMAAAAGKADVSALFSHVSENFSDQDISREGLRILAEAVFDHYGPIRVSVRRTGIRIVGAMAVVELDLWASDSSGSVYGSSSWTLEMVRESDGAWRVTGAVPMRIGGAEVGSWGVFHEVTGF